MLVGQLHSVEIVLKRWIKRGYQTQMLQESPVIDRVVEQGHLLEGSRMMRTRMKKKRQEGQA